MRATRLLGAVGALLVATVAVAGPAAAHDELVNATPRAGATVAGLPEQVSLAFDQRVVADLSVVRVTGPGGRVLSSGPPTVAGTIVTQHTAGVAPAGAYRLAYRVVSADGHPVTGGWRFTVTAAGASQAAVPTALDAPGAPDAPGRPGLPHGTGLLAVAAIVVAAAGSLALRSRVVRRARALDADAEPVAGPADDLQAAR